MTRDHIQLSNVECLPTGKGMAAGLQNVNIVLIYAPSGAEKRRGRENFFFERIPIPTARHSTIVPV